MITLPIDTVCEFTQYTDRWVIAINGPYGYVTCALPGTVNIQAEGAMIETSDAFSEKRIQKMIIGASVGFKRYLRIRGVGYHLKPTDDKAVMLIAGFSYDLKCPVHPSITMKATRKFSMIKVQSKYIATITNNLAVLRNTRKADIYRGLGIYYRYEKILYKPGSKQKSK